MLPPDGRSAVPLVVTAVRCAALRDAAVRPAPLADGYSRDTTRRRTATTQARAHVSRPSTPVPPAAVPR